MKNFLLEVFEEIVSMIWSRAVLAFLIIVAFIVVLSDVARATTIEETYLNDIGCEMYAGFVNSVAYYRDSKVPEGAIAQMIRDETVQKEIVGMEEFLISEVARVYAMPDVDREKLAGAARDICFSTGGHVSEFSLKGL